ncbi:MAG: WYL domain-containing protein [Oscillospiraceae bacterium]|nr:WYL domain-containing protein [Oscillospiraceae bacterium]
MTANSKLRLFYIRDILSKYSDEEHPLNSTDIIGLLESEYGVSCERKTVYDCIEALSDYGYDIIKAGTKKGFFMASREFELPEIRVLIDAVQSADFISAKKTKALLKKFGEFASKYQYSKIEKQVYIENRNKRNNESLFYTINELHDAIIAKKQVKIIYRKRKISDDIKPHYEEKELLINPYCLIWSDDHYYLVGNHAKYDNLIHLRIDRIKSVMLTDNKARHFSEVSPYKTSFDAADYSNKHLSMFSGDIKPVELICKNEIIEEFLDEFGEKTKIFPHGNDSFSARLNLAVTPGLVSKIMQYGDNITVRTPNELRNMIIDKSKSILQVYDGEKR